MVMQTLRTLVLRMGFPPRYIWRRLMVARSRKCPPLCLTSEALRLGLSLLLEELMAEPFFLPIFACLGLGGGWLEEEWGG